MVGARITSTMQDDFPLTITSILMHGSQVFGRSECVTWAGRRGPGLENLLAGSPNVVEAAVIGIPHEKWTERPLACVVVSQDTDPMTLAEFLDGKVAHWQVPEKWAFIEEVPKTTVGKFDKRCCAPLPGR